jgi:23S rRNA pseudouridine2605 synthase
LATTAKRPARRRALGPPGTVPLARALSKLGLASRTDAERLIAEGRVQVEGRRVTRPGLAVNPERVRISIDGQRPAPVLSLTIAFHKPRGVVTTSRDPEGRPTIYDYLQDVPARVIAVGRLDWATSGLLLLTTDTRLAERLTNPESRIPRIYLVTVRGRVDEPALAALRSGVHDAGEWLRPAHVECVKNSGRESLLRITLTEGRNREVRRLCTAVGHAVTRLRRVQFGAITLGTLPPGHWREVTADELQASLGTSARGRSRAADRPQPPRGGDRR